MARTYLWPKYSVEGMEAVESFNANGGRSHISSLRKEAVNYISRLDKICRSSTTASSKLDKPNVHMNLEIYVHTIPLLGHVRHFAELPFECAHQPLKRAIERSN